MNKSGDSFLIEMPAYDGAPPTLGGSGLVGGGVGVRPVLHKAGGARN